MALESELCPVGACYVSEYECLECAHFKRGPTYNYVAHTGPGVIINHVLDQNIITAILREAAATALTPSCLYIVKPMSLSYQVTQVFNRLKQALQSFCELLRQTDMPIYRIFFHPSQTIIINLGHSPVRQAP